MIQKTKPAEKLAGTLVMPPDKSISHRAALFAAISDENSIIENYSSAADPQSTLSCLRQLGVSIQKKGNRVEIEGVGRDGFRPPESPLDCGNSGTTMRLLSGIMAGAGIKCKLIGDESLSSRTMKRIIDPLRQMGCDISGRDEEFAPIRIEPHNGLNPLRYPLPIASAQLKSSVLLAGLFGDEPTEVIETVPSRDHTERLLGLKSEPFGTGKIIRSSRSDVLPAQNYEVPGDFSAAAFWLVAGSINSGAELDLVKVGMNPSRTGIYHILEEMGAQFTQSNSAIAGKEPVSDISVKSAQLNPIELDPKLIPNCIDELPVLMVAMCFADGRSVITGAEELRHKETDRLSAMAEILASAGAEIELQKDGMIIHGNPDFTPKPARFKSYHDHRMAMAAAVLSTRSSGSCEVEDAECTSISYPQFWTHLHELTQS
ncbi:3-phosphoshikimate 1-carboxyvinyltransferase [Rhodohalobacter barkolensis]|uniref:3-phosphoshikimate 1-carboxyvinyltransferase n=1 Tax=Rhodohalobacter barkolensis TaxID=2053187 RepID=A0A2N0VI64_9BACT|nr:3-phosphoshikimate 1-carboxyvinyltransferase [Rhodohalobacter barkolensis]PKD43828.1 3-phosphoshikimate 1-carboxyvinyltransferase [Rhodohalobacter barkolensis]